MPESPVLSNGTAAWVKRVVEVFDAVNKIGLSMVLLGLGIATYYGWIASPFSTVPETLRVHDQNMLRLLDDKQRLDVQVLDTINAIRRDMSRNSEAYRIRICSDIRDGSVRKRCLDQ